MQVEAAAEKGLSVAAGGRMLDMSTSSAEKGLGTVVGGLAVGELHEEAGLDLDVSRVSARKGLAGPVLHTGSGREMKVNICFGSDEEMKVK